MLYILLGIAVLWGSIVSYTTIKLLIEVYKSIEYAEKRDQKVIDKHNVGE